jgi:hypothetical protein
VLPRAKRMRQKQRCCATCHEPRVCPPTATIARLAAINSPRAITDMLNVFVGIDIGCLDSCAAFNTSCLDSCTDTYATTTWTPTMVLKTAAFPSFLIASSRTRQNPAIYFKSTLLARPPTSATKRWASLGWSWRMAATT